MNSATFALLVQIMLLIGSASAGAQEAPVPSPATRVHLADVARRPLGHRLFGVFGNTVLSSDDDGVTWIRHRVESADVPASCTAFRSITFFDSQNAWISGDCQTVYRSSDGGSTWKLVSAGNAKSPPFVRLVFHDVTAGIAADSNGQLLLTSDAGRTWESFLEGEDANGFFIAAMGRTGLHDVSVLGGEWKSGVDDYEEFGAGGSSGTLEGEVPKIGRDFVARGSILLSGLGWVIPQSRDTICWVSTSRPWTWRSRPVEGLRRAEKILDVTFDESGLGWLIGDRGTLLSTKDSGRHWKRVGAVTISRFLEMGGWKLLALNKRGEVFYAGVFGPSRWEPAVLSNE